MGRVRRERGVEEHGWLCLGEVEELVLAWSLMERRGRPWRGGWGWNMGSSRREEREGVGRRAWRVKRTDCPDLV